MFSQSGIPLRWKPEIEGAVTAVKAYLEGSQSQFKDQSLLLADIFRGEGEDSVVNTKQGNEQEGGACQTPTHTDTQTHTQVNKIEV